MIYDNIPRFIKDTGQFCNWCCEIRKGRKTKIPYNPSTKQRCQVNHLETFVDFQTAVDAVEDYDGIGIRVNDRIIGIDLDHCVVGEQFFRGHWRLFSTSTIPTSNSVQAIRAFVFLHLCRMAMCMTKLPTTSKRAMWKSTQQVLSTDL